MFQKLKSLAPVLNYKVKLHAGDSSDLLIAFEKETAL